MAVKPLDMEEIDFRRRIWEKAAVVNGYNADFYRQDAGGAWIAFDSFGDEDNVFGWEIDHVLPLSKGGDDLHEENLRPMHIANIRSKGDNYPKYLRAVTSEGIHNVDAFDFVKVNENLQKTLSKIYGL